MTSQPTLPTYHIRPARGWLNDPNGMTYHDGRWHVFFQHNPAAAVHDRIQWGHVSSDDLVTWREHPVAFGPQDGGPDAFGCWTGVFVPGDQTAVVAYSGVVDTTFRSSVCLRMSSDPRLDHWSDPVVVCETPDDPALKVMRDPFVFTWGGRRWAIQGAGMNDGTPAILLFGCDDLGSWTYEGVWFTDDGLIGERWPADIWECPQLVEVDGRSVLVLSTQLEGRLCDVVAVVGDLAPDPAEAARPSFVAESAQRLDEGDAFYAPQFMTDPSGNLHVGWIRQEGVAADEHDGDPDLQAGCLTLPRRLRVRDGRVVVRRDPAVAGLLAQDATTLTAGDHDLPRTCRLEVAGGRLTGADDEIVLPDRDGTEVWLDGEVVEIYPAAGVPRTYRQVGTSPWRLTVTADTTLIPVEVRSTPAR